jgi:hypothetical protein
MDENKYNPPRNPWYSTVGKVLSDSRSQEFLALTALNVSVATRRASRVFSYNCKARRYTEDPCELPPPNARVRNEGALAPALALVAWSLYAPEEITYIRRKITCKSPDGEECD